MFVMPYNPDDDRPFGRSRITPEVRWLIDCAVRANVNEEIAAAFAASTQKYLLGTDGDAIAEGSKWSAFIGSIMEVSINSEGSTPQFGQLSQPSMQPMTDHFANLCKRMCAATGIHVGQFGIMTDNPTSAEAIYAESEPLILKCKSFIREAKAALSRVAVAAIATEEGTSYADALEAHEVSVHFLNPAMPTLAQQTDSSIKLASAVEGFAGSPTFWRMNGFDDDEVRDAANDVLRSLNATVMANAERDRRDGVRFARVPTGWETCTFCLMLASRGAVYHTRKTAGEFKHFHRRCDCKVVPGFEDDPMAELVEGHDPKTYKRLWRRMNSATIYEKELYVASRKSIASEANALEAAMQDLFKSIKKTHRYIDLMDRFLRRFEGGGSITSQYWAKPEGKEIQLASWLAGKGHDVEFLTPSSIKGSHTPDMRLDGELWEMKRVETGVRKKMKQRVSEGLRQAPNVIVDLSINAHDTAALELAAVGMLDDPRAEKIMVIRDGVAMLYAK